MSASGALQPDQFGSYAQWHDAQFRPVRLRQFEQIKSAHTKDMDRARTARQAGDRQGAVKALDAAGRSRQMIAGWTHLKR